MKIQALVLALSAAALMACTTTSGDSQPDRDRGDRPRGIVGEWEVKPDDSILTCTLIVKRGSRRGEGSASDRGCIAQDGLGFVRNWKREDGRIKFFAIGNEEVLTVRRSGPDTFRGRLTRSDRRVTLTRK
ncbi:MAG: AprI/Inh family metalloprotease inhibitor [Pseudomonadota bacterium]